MAKQNRQKRVPCYYVFFQRNYWKHINMKTLPLQRMHHAIVDWLISLKGQMNVTIRRTSNFHIILHGISTTRPRVFHGRRKPGARERVPSRGIWGDVPSKKSPIKVLKRVHSLIRGKRSWNGHVFANKVLKFFTNYSWISYEIKSK